MSLAVGPVIVPAVDQERALMVRLIRLPEILLRSAELRGPNVIAEYAHDVATDFSRFYEACHILSEEDPLRQASWLGLVATTLRTLTLLLDLLGIDIPERM